MSFRYIIVGALILCVIPLSAQQQDRYAERKEENFNLEKEIARLAKSVDSLAAAKDALQSKSNRCKDEMALMNKEIDSLDSLLKGANILKEKVDTLKVCRKRLDSILWNKKRLLEEGRVRYVELQEKLRSMKPYERVAVEKKYEQSRQILDKKYSQITEEELALIARNVEQFKDCKHFDEYKKKIESVKYYRSLYVKGNTLINEVSNEASIESMRDQLASLIEKGVTAASQFRMSKTQFNELDTLDIKLSRYCGGIAALKSVIQKVNTDNKVIVLRAAKDEANCRERIMSIVDPQKSSFVKPLYDRYFNFIPYIKKLFDAYVEELKANPLGVGGRVEEQIQKM